MAMNASCYNDNRDARPVRLLLAPFGALKARKGMLMGLYDVVLILHNSFAGLTLLLALVAAVILLATSRTTSRGASLALRVALISASLQFVFGLVLVVLGLVGGNAAGVAALWLHYLLGIISVGVLSAVAARGRRAPDTQARQYGLRLLGVVLLVLMTFLVGQYRYQPF